MAELPYSELRVIILLRAPLLFLRGQRGPGFLNSLCFEFFEFMMLLRSRGTLLGV